MWTRNICWHLLKLKKEDKKSQKGLITKKLLLKRINILIWSNSIKLNLMNYSAIIPKSVIIMLETKEVLIMQKEIRKYH